MTNPNDPAEIAKSAKVAQGLEEDKGASRAPEKPEDNAPTSVLAGEKPKDESFGFTTHNDLRMDRRFARHMFGLGREELIAALLLTWCLDRQEGRTSFAVSLGNAAVQCGIDGGSMVEACRRWEQIGVVKLDDRLPGGMVRITMT